MEKKHLFIAYVKEKRRLLILFFLLLSIWVLYGQLNYQALGDSLYLVAIWVFIIMVFGMLDYLKYRGKYKELLYLQKRIEVSVEALPKPENIREEQYQECLRMIHSDKMEQLTREAKKQADMGEYFTIWAHQIKTPIAGMSLLLQTSDSADKEELQSELFSIEQYVDMVLTYLRLGFEENDLVLGACEIEPIVKKAIRKFAGFFIRKKLNLKLASLSGTVVTDEKWLLFVIEQLLSNAIKYTDKGGITITFQNNILCIADTGIGIASEDLPRIFEKGYTGYNGRLDKKSSGIGLYLCRQIMEKLGGSIRAESEVSVGSCFYLSFPRDNGRYE